MKAVSIHPAPPADRPVPPRGLAGLLPLRHPHPQPDPLPPKNGAENSLIKCYCILLQGKHVTTQTEFLSVLTAL